MKIKTILIYIVIFLAIFLIYFFTKDNEIYYLNISDLNTKYNNYLKDDFKRKNELEKYINYTKNIRTTDLIRNIEENEKIENITIQNAIIKADIITLSIGNNDINYKINTSTTREMYIYIDEMLEDIDKLYKLLRKYSKEKIYMIGYYNYYNISNEELINYLNLRIKDKCKDYNIKYIDISNLNINDFNKKELGLTGNKKIYEKLKNKIK